MCSNGGGWELSKRHPALSVPSHPKFRLLNSSWTLNFWPTKVFVTYSKIIRQLEQSLKES